MLIYAAGRAEQNIKLNIDTRCCLQNVAMTTSTAAAKRTTAQQTPKSVERNLNLLQQTQRFGQNMPWTTENFILFQRMLTLIWVVKHGGIQPKGNHV